MLKVCCTQVAESDMQAQPSMITLRALALFQKLLLLLGPETTDRVISECCKVEVSWPAQADGAFAVEILTRHINLLEESSVGPIASRGLELDGAAGEEAATLETFSISPKVLRGEWHAYCDWGDGGELTQVRMLFSDDGETCKYGDNLQHEIQDVCIKRSPSKSSSQMMEVTARWINKNGQHGTIKWEMNSACVRLTGTYKNAGRIDGPFKWDCVRQVSFVNIDGEKSSVRLSSGRQALEWWNADSNECIEKNVKELDLNNQTLTIKQAPREVSINDTDGDLNIFTPDEGQLFYRTRSNSRLPVQNLMYDANSRRLGAAGWSMTIQSDLEEVERVLSALVRLAVDAGVPHNISLPASATQANSICEQQLAAPADGPLRVSMLRTLVKMARSASVTLSGFWPVIGKPASTTQDALEIAVYRVVGAGTPHVNGRYFEAQQLKDGVPYYTNESTTAIMFRCAMPQTGSRFWYLSESTLLDKADGDYYRIKSDSDLPPCDGAAWDQKQCPDGALPNPAVHSIDPETESELAQFKFLRLRVTQVRDQASQGLRLQQIVFENEMGDALTPVAAINPLGSDKVYQPHFRCRDANTCCRQGEAEDAKHATLSDDSKWVTAQAADGVYILQLEFSEPVMPYSYHLITADTEPGSDPIRWLLEGSNDRLAWHLLHDMCRSLPNPLRAEDRNHQWPAASTSVEIVPLGRQEMTRRFTVEQIRKGKSQETMPLIQLATGTLSRLSRQSEWQPALKEFTSIHLGAEILPSKQNTECETFGSNMRRGAVALGLWGGWGSIPQIGQSVSILTGGSGIIVGPVLAHQKTALIAAADYTISPVQLSDLVVEQHIMAPEPEELNAILQLLHWHLNDSHTDGTCGWIRLHQTTMLLRAVSLLVQAKPAAAVDALVERGLLRSLLQLALQSESDAELAEMITQREVHFRRILVQILARGNDKTGKSVADQPVQDTTNAINSEFAFRKIQFANVDVSEQADSQGEALVFETQASLKEYESSIKKASKEPEAPVMVPEESNELSDVACDCLHSLVRIALCTHDLLMPLT